MNETYTVRECLHGYAPEALGAICENWKLAAGTKPSRIRAIDRILSDAFHIEQGLAGLGPVPMRLLHIIASREHVTAPDVLSVPGLYGSHEPLEDLLRLAKLGLVLVAPMERMEAFSFAHLARGSVEGQAGHVLFVPGAVRKQLDDPPSLGYKLHPAETAPSPESVLTRDGATTSFLETLRVVEIVTPRLTHAGGIHRSDEGRAKEMAHEAHVSGEDFSLSLMMARKLGCVHSKEGRLTTTEAAEQWAQHGDAERMRDLFQAYLASEDLFDLKLFFPQIYEAMLEHLPEGSLRRTYHKRLAATLLAELRPQTWYSLEDFLMLLRRADGNVLFLEEHWRAIKSNAREATPSWRQRAWQAGEQRLYAWMLGVFLAKLRMIVLTEDQNLFQITPLGAYALGVEATEEREATDAALARDQAAEALVVQPDFEVIVYHDLCPPDLRRKLDTFCERVRAGDVGTYRVTKESVYRGVRGNSSLSRFMNLLEEHSSRPLPGNVREQFLTWQRKLESITVRAAANVLECDSEEAARAVAAETEGARHVGGRYIVLGAEEAPHDREIDYAKPLPACVEQPGGLEVRVARRDRHFFAGGRLAAFGDVAEENGTLHAMLDKDHIKTFSNWGLAVADLEALAKEPLAARYRLAIRAWAGDGAAATTQTVSLVRFDDPEVAEALLELPELAEHIEGRLGLYALVIRKSHLAKFKRAVKAYGVHVSTTEDISDPEPPEVWAPRWVEDRQEHDEPAPPDQDSEEAADNEGDAGDISLPSYSPSITREIIEDAIERRRTVMIAYATPWSGRPSVRRVNPVSLDIGAGSPAMSGYCHLTEGARTFKLVRISGIRVLEAEEF